MWLLELLTEPKKSSNEYPDRVLVFVRVSSNTLCLSFVFYGRLPDILSVGYQVLTRPWIQMTRDPRLSQRFTNSRKWFMLRAAALCLEVNKSNCKSASGNLDLFKMWYDYQIDSCMYINFLRTSNSSFSAFCVLFTSRVEKSLTIWSKQWNYPAMIRKSLTMSL